MLAHAWGFSSNDGHKQTRTRYTKQKQIQRAERVDTSVFACLDQETRKAIQEDFFFFRHKITTIRCLKKILLSKSA